MRIFPEGAALKQDRLFAAVYWGECLLLAAGIWVASKYSTQSIFLVGSMCLAVVARAFLIWAWGHRFPETSLFYMAWTIPGLLRDALLGVQCSTYWVSKGFSIHGDKISTGDSSIAVWGAVLLVAALLIRSLGLGWVAFHRSDRIGPSWPAFILATITAYTVFSYSMTLFQSGTRGILMSLFFIPQYGFQIYL